MSNYKDYRTGEEVRTYGNYNKKPESKSAINLDDYINVKTSAGNYVKFTRCTVYKPDGCRCSNPGTVNMEGNWICSKCFKER
jgi:hypothetical protein